MPANTQDALVIGGGHNGLIAAAYLAKGGASVCVLEARAKTGGATDTMSPWPEAPEFRVSTLSYVMSLMPERIISDLDLRRHGYRIFPQGIRFHPLSDGRAIIGDGGAREHASIAQFSQRDAERHEAFWAWLTRLAGLLAPMLMEAPPRLGSRHASDVLDQLRFVMRRRHGMDVRTVADITKLFTMSAEDLLREWFESSELIGEMAMPSVLGAWGGPDTPGTAYVLMHLSMGLAGSTGHAGAWGYPEGGMGAVADACRKAAEAAGAIVRVNAPVEQVLVRGGRAEGVVLTGGEELRAPVVITTTHPKIAFERHVAPEHLPDDFRRDIANWRSRSGMVKVNIAVDRAPRFTADPEGDPDILGGEIGLLDGVEDLADAFADARAGRAAERPFADLAIPTAYDRTLAPEGAHIVSLCSQFVPARWADEDHPGELEAYADRLVGRIEAVAPGFTDSIVARQVIGPREMQTEWHLVGGSVYHGELTPNQLFHMRPAPGYADYRTPVRGLYQASSATHGGGGVTGLPGHHVVRAILADKALRRSRRQAR